MGAPDEREAVHGEGPGAHQGVTGTRVTSECSKLGEASLHPLGFTLVGQKNLNIANHNIL